MSQVLSGLTLFSISSFNKHLLNDRYIIVSAAKGLMIWC